MTTTLGVYATYASGARVQAVYDPWPTTGEPLWAVICDGCGRINTAPDSDASAKAAAVYHAAICIC